MAITVENLTKKYGQQTAVNDISFQIKTGEIVGFLGPNGAGKSTTMKMITCYMAPTAGDVRLHDYSVRKQPQEVKKRIGYLPENNPLYTDMAIVDYLRFSAQIQGVESALISSRIKKMIDMCGLGLERHKKIHELSKGYRQRVGLAQAMIHEPEVLVLDEPTTGLDPNQIIEIRKLIKELGKEKTVIFSSHILAEVEATCDRIIIINRGNIVADGSSENLRAQSQGQEILTISIEASSQSSVKEALSKIPSVADVKEISGKSSFYHIKSAVGASSRKAIFEMCVSNQWYLLEMSGTETSLEDVFRQLTSTKK